MQQNLGAFTKLLLLCFIHSSTKTWVLAVFDDFVQFFLLFLDLMHKNPKENYEKPRRNVSWCPTTRLSASSSCRSEPKCVAQKQLERSQQMEVKECLNLEITRELAISGFYAAPAQVASARNAAVKNVSVRSEDEPIKERSPSSRSSYLSHTWFGLIRNPKRVFT